MCVGRGSGAWVVSQPRMRVMVVRRTQKRGEVECGVGVAPPPLVEIRSTEYTEYRVLRARRGRSLRCNTTRPVPIKAWLLVPDRVLPPRFRSLALVTLINTNFKSIFYFNLETILESIAAGWISSLCSIIRDFEMRGPWMNPNDALKSTLCLKISLWHQTYRISPSAVYHISTFTCPGNSTLKVVEKLLLVLMKLQMLNWVEIRGTGWGVQKLDWGCEATPILGSCGFSVSYRSTHPLLTKFDTLRPVPYTLSEGDRDATCA